MTRVAVQFLVSVPGYSAGEIAGFDKEHALRMAQRGVVKLVEIASADITKDEPPPVVFENGNRRTKKKRAGRRDGEKRDSRRPRDGSKDS